MKTKERKTMRRRWILLGILLAAVVAVGSFAMGETPERPVSAGERGAPSAANGSAEAGAFTLTGDNLISDTDYTYDATNGVLTLQTLKAVTIENTDKEQETTDGILISDMGEGQTVNLTLAGVKINTSGTSDKAALKIAYEAQCHVNITLNEGSTNALQSGMDCAGLEKDDYPFTITNSGTLTIGGTGSLTAKGEMGGAGIGGGSGRSGSNITIKSGTVIATGGSRGDGGAGIGGGGDYGSGRNITISGGTVTATGGKSGAGIGGGSWGSGSDITISGGEVMATDGGKAAGIGGGYVGSGSGITISGGEVMATGGLLAAGIGGGYGGSGSNNTLEGDVVVLATSGVEREALDGFDAGLTRGIAFTRQGKDAQFAGTVYGEIVTGHLPDGNLSFPENTDTLTIPAGNNAFTIDNGKTLSIPGGVTLINQQTLTNQGTIENEGTIDNQGMMITESENITCGIAGTVTTKVSYVEDLSNAIPDRDILYLDNAGEVKTYIGEDLPMPEKIAGYTFQNWCSDFGRMQDIIADTTPVELNTHILYAKWTETMYTVTFDTKGGSPASWTEQVKEGETVTKPTPDPERTGYTFQGWYENGDPYDFDTLVTRDLTIYAVWQGNIHNIIVPGQPTGGRIEVAQTAKTGDTVTFKAVPDSGYRIKGLPQVNTTNEMANGSINVTPTGNENEYQFTMEDSDVTVTAEFELAPQPGPSVDPGSDGGSAKTGDPFAGGIALVLLGAASFAGIALTKRK